MSVSTNYGSNEAGSEEEKIRFAMVAHGIADQDLEVIRETGGLVRPKLTEFLDQFYEWMKTQDYFRQYFSNPEMLQQVKGMQAGYWQEFFRAELNAEYYTSRTRVGEIHARIGLPLTTYFSGMSKFLSLFENEIDSPKGYSAVARLALLDTSLTVTSYYQVNNELIQERNRMILEMSTPVTSIWQDILLLPIVGIMDSSRAQKLMESILTKISVTQSKVLILDISGVGVVDTGVANHIIKICKATKLMGCSSMISGVSPAIAQTIVELGIDVESITTTATMQDSLILAFKTVGANINH